MHSITQITGSYKGIIGEACYASCNTAVVLTKLTSKNKFLFLPKKVLDNWYSFDALTFNPLKIYEIKSTNAFYFGKYGKPKVTENQVRLLQELQNAGVIVIVVFVLFENNGTFSIIEKEFSVCDFCIDSSKNGTKNSVIRTKQLRSGDVNYI